MEENVAVSNVPNEILFVGALYSNAKLFTNYSRVIKSQYDFYDEVAKFLYDVGELMYSTYSQDFTENNINIFMIQDDERKKLYRSYGGWKTIKKSMEISNNDDVGNYYDTLKKYSLLRELQTKGFDVSKLMNHKNFQSFDAEKISQLMRRKMDKINTVILCDKESNDLVVNASEKVMEYTLRPMAGIPTPWKLINEVTKGLMLKKEFCVGMLSNAGKSRLLMCLATYVFCMLEQRVSIMSNEMDYETMFSCMITTIINNKEIKEKYGWEIDKTEEDITMGRYKDINGNYIERAYDGNGNPLLSDEDYQKLLLKESPELRELLKITEFLENNMDKLIFFKDVGDNYSDETIAYEMRKHNQIYNVKYFFYDTLKGYLQNNWDDIKQTTTKIREVAKELDSFIFFDFQLSDDAILIDPMSLTSMNIANSKAIKHIVDFMFLCKEINANDFFKYEYCSFDSEWGEPAYKDLNPKYRYMIWVTDKNRRGRKPYILMKFDLDRNIWDCVGEVRHKEFVAKEKKKKY